MPSLHNPSLKHTSIISKLVILYVLSVVVRFGLALISSAYPIVLVDEILYYSMGRSIATEGQLLYLGQSADYSSILYPLIISPIYFFASEGMPIYRLIQLWNILLMSSSVFPIFFLSKSVSKNDKTALIVTVVTVFLPDMILGQIIFSECIIYPLTYCLLLCTWHYIEKGKSRYLLLAGLLSGFIYSAKPGHIALLIGIICCLLIRAVNNKDKKVFLHIGVVIISTIFSSGLIYILGKLCFSMSSSLFSIYDYQLDVEKDLHLGSFFRGILLSPYYLLLGSALFPVVLPILFRKRYSINQQCFLNIIWITIGIIIFGTSWAVNRAEYGSPTIHTRYFAMYVPLLILYCCMLNYSEPIKAKNISFSDKKDALVPLSIIMGYILMCTLIVGCQSGINNDAPYVFNLLVSFLRWDSTLLLNALVIISVFTVTWMVLYLNTKMLKNTAVIAILLIAVVNNANAYKQTSFSKEIVCDNKEMQQLLYDQEYIYIYGTNRRFYNAYLDCNSTQNTSMVYINDLYNNMIETDGVFIPFIPAISRGMLPDREIPNTSILVLDRLAMSQLKLSANAKVLYKTTNENLYLVEIPHEERWLESIVGGVVESTLTKGTPAYIRLFGGETSSVQKVSVDIELLAESEIIIQLDQQKYLFTLPACRDIYEIELPSPAQYVIISCADSDINFYGYSLE